MYSVHIPLGADIPAFLASGKVTHYRDFAPEDLINLANHGWTEKQVTEQIARGYRCRDRSVPVVLYTHHIQTRWVLENTQRITAESAQWAAEDAVLHWEDLDLSGYRVVAGTAHLGDHEGRDAWLVCIQPIATL